MDTHQQRRAPGDHRRGCLDGAGYGINNGTLVQLFDCFPAPIHGNQAFFPSVHTPLASTKVVTDGQWHHAVLTAAGSSQTLYLDGQSVGTKAGVVQDFGTKYQYVGTGFLGGAWPAQTTTTTVSNAGTAKYFAGSVGDVAVFDQPLTAATVSSIYRAGSQPANLLTSVVRPSGNPSATVVYDGDNASLSQVTDANGGVWKVSAPTVSGSSQVYVGSVLSAGPTDYWRLAESGTSTAVNQVKGNDAAYNSVTLGNTGGPFDDATVASFNGSSSWMTLPAADIPGTGPNSISMWFKMPAGNTAGGVLFDYQGNALGGDPNAPGGWVPALYVGTDGKLRGQFWGAASAMVSPSGVNDGQWHHVVLAASTNSESLYLDGAKIGGPVGGTLQTFGASNVYVGAGKWQNWAATSGAVGYFPGSIAEVAFYKTQLNDAQVALQYGSRAKATGVPAKTVTVTDPGGKTITHVYDVATGHEVAVTDTLGNKTQYGYDEGGFLRTATDPNGNVTTTEHDVRGNTVSQTTCQDRPGNKCSTVYYTYFPDAITKTLTPNPLNDLMLTQRDGRSSSATDNTYLTTYGYDSKGNRTTVTDPLGRVTTTTYTDGTSVLAADGGPAPAGLPATLTTAGGAKQTIVYYKSGDVASVTDPAGKVTTFAYDGIGRVLTKTETTNTFPSGLTTTLVYDKLGRVVSQNQPAVTDRVTGAVHTPVATTVYNPDGLVTSQTVADTTGGDASRTTSTTYNQYGQAASVTDPAGKVTQLEYDAYGNTVKETGPDGGVTTSTYDAEQHLLTSTLNGYTGDPNNPSPATNLVVVSKAYDPAGRLASVTDAMGWVTSYTYTDNGLSAKAIRKDPGTGATFVEESNSYDAAGNLITKVTNDGATATSFAVDAASRTTSSTLDPAGLKRTTTMAYSPDDYVTSTTLTDGTGAVVTTSDRTYDPMGRMTSQNIHLDGAGKPNQWWKLNETAGTVIADSSGSGLTATGTDITWSGGTAGFNGTTSKAQLPSNTVSTNGNQTVSLWFKASAGPGVLFSYQRDPVTNPTTPGDYIPALYLGTDGRLFGEFWADGSASPVSTQASVADGQWHHVVLSGASSTQTLYLDGAAVATRPGQISTSAATSANTYLGSGFLGGGWPDEPHQSGTDNTGYPTPFTGSLSNAQVYPRALSAADVSTLYGNGRTGSALSINLLTTSWTLDKGGLATAMTDPNGNVTSYAYDEAGHQVVTTKPAVMTEIAGGTPVSTRPISYAGYNTFGEVVETKDPNGNVTVAGYDAAGRPISTKLPSYTPPGSSTPIVPVSTRAYDSMGQLTGSTDALGKTTSYLYDQFGRVAKVTAPNLGETKLTYDLVGDQLSTTDPTGAVSTATYDYLGRRLTSTQVVRQANTNYTTTLTYGTGGWLASTKSPAGVITSTTYDAAGAPLTVKDGAGNVTGFVYDAAGRRVKTTQPDGTYTTATYDAASRTVASAAYDATGAVQTTQSTVFDNAGNALASKDPRGTTTTFTYDATGLLTSEVQPINGSDSITTSFGYDVSGNRSRFTDGRGNAFITTYNTWNLPESQLEPSTTAHPNPSDRTFTTSYDANGRALTQALPGGVSVTNTYDPVGNLTQQAGAGADAATATRTFGYDLAGRVTSASGSAGGITLAYDDRGLPLSATGVAGNSSFTYTADGTMASRADAAGTTNYTYDGAGRLATVANPTAGAALSYAYNTMSQVAGVTYGTNGNARSLSYDPLHRLTVDELKTPAAASIAKIVYGYDANGNETSKTTTGFSGSASNTYTYDLADRLTSWNNGTTTTVYAYDKSGNRVQAGSRTFSYDQRNRLTSGSDGTTYAYTPRGTLASTVKGGTTLATTSDAFGQVVSQAASATQTQTYQYDGLGRVIRSGFAYSGKGNTLAGDGTASYVRDPGDGLVGVVSGGNQRLVWTDQHTDVVGQFSATGTTLTGSTTYDPLGKVLSSSAMLGNLGYQSEWTDSATSRVNMMARWYNTDTGQFDSRDAARNSPVPDSVNANQYAYGNDNPLTNTDPSGNWSLGGVWNSIKSGAKAAASVVTSVASTAYSWGSSAYSWGSSMASSMYHGLGSAASWVGNQVASVANTVVNVAKSAVNVVKHSAVGRWVAHKVDQAKQRLKAVYNHYKQAAKVIVAKATRVVHQAVNSVKDAYHATEKWVKEHKDLIIEVAAIGAGVLAGLACTAATAGVGAVACMVGASALVNLAKDAAQGHIHSFGDALGSALKGGAQGLLGAAGGVIGGKVAGLVVGKLGGLAASVGGRMLSGAISGGVGDAFTQFATTGHVSWGGVAMSAGIGAVFGGASRGGARGGAKSDEPTPGRRASDDEPAGASCPLPGHSFDPDTRVVMADGSTRPIKDVNVGDKVAATDPKTDKTDAQPVVALHLNHDTDLTDLTVTTDHGAKGTKSGGRNDGSEKPKTTVLKTTQHHPFWDKTAGIWVLAAALVVGHQFSTLDGDTATVTAVHNYSGAKDMRDLTVDSVHTYYVVAAGTPVLVHNCNTGQPRGADGRYERDPNAAPRAHTRDTEYPSGYRASTHDEMRKRWTDPDGTWRDEQGNSIDPADLTYDHVTPVVDHWNSTGNNTSRAARNDWYNDPDNLRPMPRSENSSGGGSMTQRYRQDTGPGYSP
ncbi:MAG: hypothetical protein AUI14_22170 [Actinobacteria bacterium 13_2_20CM_2_71_6]|nr:MAG: hypothetical protein AUI14_22170 [Actinobacteria bacterium 13_2_20CM_2_71_6]